MQGRASSDSLRVMTRPSPMSVDEINAKLPEIAGWTYGDNHLTKTFEFADFVQAFGFMSKCALVAERLAHHPDWSNVYKTVVVKLSTHDAGGVTSLDFDLATAMNQLC